MLLFPSLIVHGEANEMKRLKTALVREYDADPDTNINFYDPRKSRLWSLRNFVMHHQIFLLSHVFPLLRGEFPHRLCK